MTTELVNTGTGEIVEVSYSDVKRSIEQAKASLEEAAEQIVWQIENQAWTVLGYAHWNEMREAEYGGAAFMVPRAERPELQARMKRAGLTNTEVAETMGVGTRTVERETAKWRNDHPDVEPPIITNARGQQRPASYAPRSTAAPTVKEAVAEFPDLAYYAETGPERHVLDMASDLRRFRERGELDMRLDNLRRSIAVDRAKRDGTFQAGTTAVMGEDGEYRMAPLSSPKPAPTRTCPTCSGRGLIQE